jgi:YHS domain-containing protein
MNAIRKSIGTILILGAAVGCAGEPEPTPAPAPIPTPAPKTSPPAPSGVGSKEMTPPPSSLARPDSSKTDDVAPKVEAPKTSDNAKPDSKATKLSATQIAAIKELPAAEQDAALAQAVCPVSTHNLGSMGAPIKVTAEGRTFYLCCDDCKDALKADPKKAIATLDKNTNAK